ncbi:MAG: hypothetical protein LIO96_05505 [Lachnospiraceae bacterium]|nr:hypothetical protein [Lachnospiraceae bacterium]
MGRKHMAACFVLAVAAALCMAGCGAQQADSASEEPVSVSVEAEAEDSAENDASETTLEDGVYQAEFSTDSSMFHINEACDGKGTLTVEDGVMTIHVSLVSRNIVNLYYGTAEEAQEDETGWIQPTEDEVTYSDGYTETVYGFDIPVPALDEEYSVAIIGTKGTWYDHTVSVSDPVAVEGETGAAEADSVAAGEDDNAAEASETAEKKSVDSLELEDGTYTIEVTLEGGTGRADIESPATITIADGAASAQITWSSSNYDYMIVGEEQYLPVSTEDGSVFEIPVDAFDYAMEVIADTTAMSEPHEIEYTIYFDSTTISAIDIEGR